MVNYILEPLVDDFKKEWEQRILPEIIVLELMNSKTNLHQLRNKVHESIQHINFDVNNFINFLVMSDGDHRGTKIENMYIGITYAISNLNNEVKNILKTIYSIDT